MKNRLVWKFAFGVTLALALVHTGHAYLRVDREVAVFESDMVRDHAAIAHALATVVTAAARQSGPEAAAELIVDADLETDRALIRWHPDDAIVVPEPNAFVAASRFDAVGGRRTLTSTLPMALGTARGVLTIQEPLDAEEKYVRDTLVRTVWMTILLVIICFLVLAIAGWIFIERPMNKVLAGVARIGRGDLSRPIALRQRDELGELADALDRMSEQLNELQREKEEESHARIAALELLRHADRLTTVGQLAAGIAHELGTPLNVVSGRAKMIARSQSEGDAAISDAQIIVAQVERMTGIVRQLLDFARHRVPERAQQNLRELCEQTLRVLTPLAKKRGVELLLAPESIPAQCNVDAGQLQQVLTNLIMNGIQAQDETGSVTVCISESSATAPPGADGPHGPHPCIAVSDVGQGIPEELRERMFEPFFTTKEVGVGTGLGLSVAHGIIQEHGGWIELESVPGRGSRFAVHLPY